MNYFSAPEQATLIPILLTLVVGLYAASLPTVPPAKFSIGNILDSVLPVINPSVNGAASRCEPVPICREFARFFIGRQLLYEKPDPTSVNKMSSVIQNVLPLELTIKNRANSRQVGTEGEALKTLFGLTYEQMQEKNSTDIHESLNIDMITKNGNVKYNLRMTKRLNRLLEDAKTIIILIHGFMESSDGLMVNGLSPGLLKLPGLKILALDGRKLINLEYFRSSTYARFMGERLGEFLGQMVDHGHDPSKITLIGHSLGAHIAGISGKQLHHLKNTTVGRIIALDPAGPCFSSNDPAGRLAKSDAAYVVAVHTNSGMLGISEPVGSIDFYPNGGASQPGCYLSTCSHSRAWELLAEAVITPDHFPARKCENWTMFQNGLCRKNQLAYLSLESNSNPPSSGSYFFTTASSVPFGLGATGSA